MEILGLMQVTCNPFIFILYLGRQLLFHNLTIISQGQLSELYLFVLPVSVETVEDNNNMIVIT